MGIDTTPLIGPRTGVGQFVAGLVDALAGHVDVVPFEMTWRGRRAGSRPLPARPMRRLWSHLDHPTIEWWTGRLDVVHGTNYVVPPSRGAEVVSVHDLTSVRFPELCTPDTLEFPGLVKRALRRGAFVHCDSQFVADEVVAWSRCDPAHVRVVPLGIPTQIRRGNAAAKSSVPEAPFDGRPYALVLGTVEPRKDHATVLRAFDALAAMEPELLLVVAGADGWGSAAYDAAIAACQPTTRPRIIRERDVSDARRDTLVAGATMLLYPSVYEGFGFPPLEAMAAGVPVVSSSAGSLPEVLGDGASFVAVGDVDALTSAMISVHSDDVLRSSLIQRGRARAASFTWERCAHEMVGLYKYAQAAR